MICNYRMMRVTFLVALGTGANGQAQQCTGPGLDFRITRRAGAATADCFEDVELSGPGSVGPVKCLHPVDLSIASTGDATITQTSSRIEITASASTFRGFPTQFNFTASGSGIVEAVFAGAPVQLTVTNRSKQVRNGVIEQEDTSPPQTIVISETNPAASFSAFCIAITTSAFQGGADSTCSGVVLTIDIQPLMAHAAAVDFHWVNPAGGSYNVGSNWDPACFPVDDGVRHDVAIFDLNTGSSIPINAAAATAAEWRFPNGTYDMTGPSELFSLADGLFTLQVSNGGHLRWTQSTLTAAGTAAVGTTKGVLSFLDIANPGATLVCDNVIIDNGFLDVGSGGALATNQVGCGNFGLGPSTVRVSGVTGGVTSNVVAAQSVFIGGGGAAATLTVSEGAFVRAGEIEIQGTALVHGTSTPNNPTDASHFAALSADSTLTVGGENQGLLTIEKGGAVQGSTVFVDAAGSGTGRIVVDGQGEFAVLNALENLTIVATEQVEVEVKGGGVLQTQAVNLGSAQGRPGGADLTIRGRTNATHDQPSRLKVFDVPAALGPAGLTAVGATAEGQLTILEGAFAQLEGGLVVGENARGVMVVSSTATGGRSTLSVTGETRIGEGANGFSTLNNAHMTAFGDLRVGFFNNLVPSKFTAETFSTMVVQGAIAVGITGPGEMKLDASTGTCGSLTVGGSSQANGKLNLSNVAELTVLGNAQVGVGAGFGEITIDQTSSLHVNGTMTIGGPFGGFGILGTGRVSVNGTLDGTGTVVVVPNGRLFGNGIVNVPKVDAGGYIDPGLSPGTLTIDGDLEMLPGGKLVIEYAGLNPGEFDVLHVTGQTTLGGRLEVHFRGDFSPNDPAGFIQGEDFVEADGVITGDYDQRIYAFPDIFADFDDDGDKDLRDVASFQNCFGLSGPSVEPTCSRADWEDNDLIDAIDVAELIPRLTIPQ